jgi:dipeptidyl aminopeptidase/acylaminoacyl peptidase
MMNIRLMLLVVVGMALMLLAGCSAMQGGAIQPSPAPLSSGPVATPASSLPTLRAAVSTATPPPERSALAADPTPTVELVVRSGRLVSAADVRVQPDGEAVGQLTAGALAIITGSRGEWLEIIFGDAPGGHGWIPQSSVSFAAAQPAAEPVPTSQPAAEQAPTSQPEAAQPAALAVAVASPQAALAGALVFQDSNGGNIYVMKADGSGLRRLTYGFDPAFSPDGSRVAFTRWDEPRGLWVINVDGSGERLLLGANRPRSPTWTPDGAAIVFERNVSEKRCRQSPFGCLTDDELLAMFGGQNCLATPFGSLCIDDFELITLRYTALTQYELASGSVRDLPADERASAPRHQPGSATVLYWDDRGFAQTQTDSDAPPQRVVQHPPLLAPATYSPDGQFIYAARYLGNRWDLWRWRSDGSQPTALTAPDPLAAQPPNHVAPSISPDGRLIVFLTDRSGPWQLWVMNSDGSNARPLAPQALAGISFRYDFNSDRVVDWGP